MKFVQNREKNWPKCNIVAKFYLIDEMIFVITFVTGSDEYNYFFLELFLLLLSDALSRKDHFYFCFFFIDFIKRGNIFVI